MYVSYHLSVLIVGEGFGSRSLLLYDGIHYDPLVLFDSHGNMVQSVFPVSDEHILVSALQIATDANQVQCQSCSLIAFLMFSYLFSFYKGETVYRCH